MERGTTPVAQSNKILLYRSAFNSTLSSTLEIIIISYFYFDDMEFFLRSDERWKFFLLLLFVGDVIV